MKTVLIGVGVVLIIAAGFLFTFNSLQDNGATLSITNFEECAAAGNPVMESYPRQCRTVDGRLFVEDIENLGDNASNIMPTTRGAGPGCVVTGCSRELCVNEEDKDEYFTICEWRPEFECYAGTTCEKQTNGQCGWTETAELRACLANPPQFEDGGIPEAM